MEDCIFCKIVKGEIPSYKVYEDDDWFAFLDISPINLGHTLLVPKKHFRNLFDLPNNLLIKLGPVVQKLAMAIKDGVKADGLNLGMNNEPAAGQLVFHAHVHLMPRFTNDGFVNWHGHGGETKEDFETAQSAIKTSLVSV